MGGHSGILVKKAYFETGAWANGNTVIPNDDSIPQIDEGSEFMSLAYTPLDSVNILEIEVMAHMSLRDPTQATLIGALFKVGTNDALAGMMVDVFAFNVSIVVPIKHFMVAGTTGTITFKYRAGNGGGNNWDFNGFAGARKLGGVMASSISIKEYIP